MKRFFFTFASAMILAVLGSMAAAKTTFYVCKLEKGNARTSWISETTGFIIDNKAASVMVIDGAIMYYFEEAIPGKLLNRGDHLEIRWTLRGIHGASGTRIPRAVYYAKLDTKNMTFSINSRLPSFENRDYGAGRCEIGKKQG